MCQAKSCFSPALTTRLSAFKKRVSKLRMPFAKQEYEGRKPKTPIKGEASIYGIDTTRGDMRFEVEGVVISIREILGEFEAIFSSITRSDILRDHRTSY